MSIRNSMFLSSAVALIAMEAATEGGGASTEVALVADAKTGTVFSKQLKEHAQDIFRRGLQNFREAYAISKEVLNLAVEACVESNGDFKLAFHKFDAAIAGAKADEALRISKIEDQTQKTTEETLFAEFCESTSNFNQYVRNMKRALESGLPLIDQGTKQPLFKTESAVRSALQNMKQAKAAQREVKNKLLGKLDVTDIPKDSIEMAFSKGNGDAALTEKLLRDLGADDLNPVDTEEQVDDTTRVFNQSMEDAGFWLGLDQIEDESIVESWEPVQSALAQLLRELQVMPSEVSEHDKQEICRVLNNARTMIGKMDLDTGEDDSIHGGQDEPEQQQQAVGGIKSL